MGEIWLITGLPGAGKTTVAALLARRFQRGVHLHAETLQEWIVRGAVHPGDEPDDEARRQLDLVIRNTCLLARSYAEAGFDVTIDYVIAERASLDLRLRLLDGLTVRMVMLAPGKEVALQRDLLREKSQRYLAETGVTIGQHWLHLEDQMNSELKSAGLWIDSSALTAEQTVEAILTHRDDALVTRMTDGQWFSQASGEGAAATN